METRRVRFGEATSEARAGPAGQVVVPPAPEAATSHSWGTVAVPEIPRVQNVGRRMAA